MTSHSYESLRQHREKWANRGTKRPSFAIEPAEGQESVWDYPRPPSLTPSTRHVIVKTLDGKSTIADTTRSLRMCETASPPTWYIPWADVQSESLVEATDARRTMCEWKGYARYWRLKEGQKSDVVAWDCPEPFKGSGYEGISNMVAFYPGMFQCFVDGEKVRPQAGMFYAGWITDDVVGPFKGDPGTGGW